MANVLVKSTLTQQLRVNQSVSIDSSRISSPHLLLLGLRRNLIVFCTLQSTTLDGLWLESPERA